MWDTLLRWAETEVRVMRAAPFAAVLCLIIGAFGGWWLSGVLHENEIADLRAAVQLDDVRAAAYQEKFCHVSPPSKDQVTLGMALEANAANTQTIKTLNAELQACFNDHPNPAWEKKHVIDLLKSGKF